MNLASRMIFHTLLCCTGDDLVSHDELRSMLHHLGMNLRSREINEVIAYIDIDMDNQISVHELDDELRRARRRQVKTNKDRMDRAAGHVRDGNTSVLFYHRQSVQHWCPGQSFR